MIEQKVIVLEKQPVHFSGSSHHLGNTACLRLKQRTEKKLCEVKDHQSHIRDAEFLMNYTAWRTLIRKRSRCARPNIWRLRNFRRLTCPSVMPLLKGSEQAAYTAA